MFRQKTPINQLPSLVDGKLQQGLSFHQRGLLDQAKTIYQDILRIKPDHADALHFLGVIEDKAKNHEQAIHLIEKSIGINPNNPSSYLNLGNAYYHALRLTDALDCYAKAISLKPDYAIAYVCRGAALELLKRFEEAINSFDTAISIKSDYAEAYWNKASALLLTGELELGWKLYEWRWRVAVHGLIPRNYSQPIWLGNQSLSGKTILLYDEQGFGDTIQFCRYVRIVAEQGARVLLDVSKNLSHLFRSLEGVSEFISEDSQIPAFDYHCPLASLPLALHTTLDTIPSSPSYLKSDAAKKLYWANRLGPAKAKRVGLVWSGNKEHANDHNRSIPLFALLPYFPTGIEYFSLQKDVRDTDEVILAGQCKIKHFGNELKDFSDTAALCELMDVVICVDTGVAHLSGALGSLTWVLLPYLPDWRWLLDRSDSPWYSSMTLYRQEKPGDWTTALEKIRFDLSALL